MSARSHDQARDRIDHEASSRIVRASEGALSPEEHRELEAWRAADARHDRTFQAMLRTWDEIPALGGLASLVPPPDPAAAPVRPQDGLRRAYRVSFAALGSAAAAVAALFLVPGAWPKTERHYATAVAKTNRVTLPDGSVVTLGARSAITVKFSDTERRVVITGGEAFFEVAHNAARPFLVEAGSSIVRDIGTKFDVNLGDRSVRVSVLEGLVQVMRTGGGAKPASLKLLRAGERAEVELAFFELPSASAAAPPAIVALPAQAPGAWREGRLVYDNVRLADLVADVNRYYAPGIHLDSGAIGDMRIMASFRTNEIPAFMSALGATLPVRATEDADGAFRVAATAN